MIDRSQGVARGLAAQYNDPCSSPTPAAAAAVSRACRLPARKARGWYADHHERGRPAVPRPVHPEGGALRAERLPGQRRGRPLVEFTDLTTIDSRSPLGDSPFVARYPARAILERGEDDDL